MQRRSTRLYQRLLERFMSGENELLVRGIQMPTRAIQRLSRFHLPLLILPKKEKSRSKVHGARTVLSAIDIAQSSQVAPLMVSAPPTRRTRARDDLSSTPIVATQQTVVQREKLSLDAAQQSISVTLGRRGSRHRIESGEEPPSKKAKNSNGDTTG